VTDLPSRSKYKSRSANQAAAPSAERRVLTEVLHLEDGTPLQHEGVPKHPGHLFVAYRMIVLLCDCSKVTWGDNLDRISVVVTAERFEEILQHVQGTHTVATRSWTHRGADNYVA